MPSEKRKKHLERQRKKMEIQRTYDERKVEYDKIILKLDKLGIPYQCEGIVKFKKILDDFLENGTQYQGVITLDDYNDRELIYFFSNNKKFDIGVMISKPK